MAEIRLINGVPYTLNAQGVPVPVDAPVMPQGVNAVPLPVNPVRAARETQEAARQASQDASTNADRQADNTRADASLALQQQTAASMNELRNIQIQAAREKAQEGKAKRTTLDALVKQVNRVEQLYKSNVEGFNWNIPAIGVAAPNEANSQFDTAGSQLSSLGLAAFRVPGTGTVSDRDAIMFDRANLPSADKYDSSIEEQLRGIRSRVESEYSAMGLPAPKWGDGDGQQSEDELDKVAAVGNTNTNGLPPVNEGGNDPTTPWDRPNADRTTAANGDYQFVDDPRTRSNIAALINSGAGYATIAAAATKAGGRAPTMQEFNAIKTWMDKNPGKEYPASAVNAGEYVPLNLGQKIAGSPAGAFTAQMANAATAGTVGALAGERGQGALDAMSALNPKASLAGTVLGGITGAAGGEGLAGAVLATRAAARFAPRVADSAFGALTGFNGSAEGEGLQGALTGAVLAPVAGSAGERAMRAGGGAVRGVINPHIQNLRAAGVPLTFGQAVGNGGWLGQGVKKIEDALTSVPGVGNVVDARRIEGLEGFNRAAFQRAGAPGSQITATGAEGMGQVRQSVQDAYGRALDPVSINANDPAFIDDLAATIQAAERIPNVNGAQEAALAGLESRVTGAIDPETELITGRGFQEAYRGLARTGRERANGDYGYEVGQVMRQGQDALASTLERQQPGQFPQFLEANAANRRAEVLAQAMNPNAMDELITPAQLNRADFNSTSRLESRVNAASGNRPFYDLATAGQAVLPSKLPDSGTATRALVGAGVTGAFGGIGAGAGGAEGAAYGTGTGALLAALLMDGGSRPVQQALTGAVTIRPEALRRLGQTIERNAQIGGGFGAGILTPLLVGSQ